MCIKKEILYEVNLADKLPADTLNIIYALNDKNVYWKQLLLFLLFEIMLLAASIEITVY